MTPLVVEKATKQFRQGDRSVAALCDVSLTVQAGQFLSVMGASGSGKSTLPHLMAGLTQPESRPDHRQRHRPHHAQRPRSHTLPPPQHRARVPGVQSHPDTHRRRKHRPAASARRNQRTSRQRRRSRRCSTASGFVRDRDHRPDAMSGGEQQRVAIGRALVDRSRRHSRRRTHRQSRLGQQPIGLRTASRSFARSRQDHHHGDA